MPHPLSHKYPIPISQLCLVNTDVPAGVGAPPLDTTSSFRGGSLEERKTPRFLSLHSFFLPLQRGAVWKEDTKIFNLHSFFLHR